MRIATEMDLPSGHKAVLTVAVEGGEAVVEEFRVYDDTEGLVEGHEFDVHGSYEDYSDWVERVVVLP